MTKPDCMIFDLDGTLFNIDHRIHLIQGNHKDYNAFNKKCIDDEIYPDIANLLYCLDSQYDIIICTGRSISVFQETAHKLGVYGIFPKSLMMRDIDNFEKDTIVKKRMLDAIQLDYCVICAFDDRDQVVKMYRDNGITCLQVKEGAY